MREKINREKLKEIASFNSGYISGGIDYWTLYLHEDYPDLIFANSEGVNFGWEYTSWEYFKKTSDDLAFFSSDEIGAALKCERIVAATRTSVHDLGLSYPE